MYLPREPMTCSVGTNILDLDGETVGEIVVSTDTYLGVSGRTAFPGGATDYLPTNIVGFVQGDNVYLRVTKEQALAMAPFRQGPQADGR